jgi:hypothetical protein
MVKRNVTQRANGEENLQHDMEGKEGAFHRGGNGALSNMSKWPNKVMTGQHR